MDANSARSPRSGRTRLGRRPESSTRHCAAPGTPFCRSSLARAFPEIMVAVSMNSSTRPGSAPFRNSRHASGNSLSSIFSASALTCLVRSLLRRSPRIGSHSPHGPSTPASRSHRDGSHNAWSADRSSRRPIGVARLSVDVPAPLQPPIPADPTDPSLEPKRSCQADAAIVAPATLGCLSASSPAIRARSFVPSHNARALAPPSNRFRCLPSVECSQTSP